MDSTIGWQGGGDSSRRGWKVTFHWCPSVRQSFSFASSSPFFWCRKQAVGKQLWAGAEECTGQGITGTMKINYALWNPAWLGKVRQFNYLITLALLASEALSAGTALPPHFILVRNCSSAPCSQLDPQAEGKERWILEGEVSRSASSRAVLCLCWSLAGCSPLCVVDAFPLTHIPF